MSFGSALVTGCNRGIGLELVKLLASRGTKVYAAVRKTSEALSAVPNVERVIEGIDVSDEKCVQELQAALKDVKLDLIVNNAGVLEVVTLENLSVDSIIRQFRINALGPLMVSKYLAPNLNNPGKLVVITSRMGSIEDNTSGGHYGYRMSKVAVNMAFKSLSHDLKPAGVAVAILHPGFVATDMTKQFNYPGAIKSSDAAARLLKRMDELTLETSGGFRHAEGQVLPW